MTSSRRNVLAVLAIMAMAMTIATGIGILLYFLSVAENATAEENMSGSLPPPGPPASQYPALSNIDSYVSEPFSVNGNQTAFIEFQVHNENIFTLYDVQVTNFSTAVIPLVLSGTDKIDILKPNEARSIHGNIAVDQLHAGNEKTTTTATTAGQSQLFWTITARKGTGTAMESIVFQRQMAVVVPEFGSLALTAIMSAGVLGGILALSLYGRRRRS